MSPPFQKIEPCPFFRRVTGQQAGSGRIIEKLAALLEEITEMVADIAPKMGAAQLLITEILELIYLSVDDDRNLFHT